MRLLVVALLALGCGGGSQPSYDVRHPKFDSFATKLTQAASGHDVAGVRAFLRESVTNGGIWFDDVDCMKEFAVPGEIGGPRLDEFARCLATLNLTLSARTDALPDVVVLTYAPGIELEARIVARRDGPQLTWIGYVARRDVADAMPTITSGTLETLRIEGDRHVPFAGPGTFEELSLMPVAHAWLKVCLDASGNVTSAHIREATSPRAARAFAEAAKTWKFRPFMLGSQPAPVCSMVIMVYPEKPISREALPLPVPAEPREILNVPNVVLGKRLKGTTSVAPDDDDRMLIHKAGVHQIISAFHYCIDTTGHVTRVTMTRSSGLPRYDLKLSKAIESWVFKPYLDEDKPIPVCASVHYIYSQS